jgi:Zn-dependent protease/predicted transcriptional regulator
MRGRIHLARAFGIDIELDWSWLVIFLLITWSLTSWLWQMHAEWGPLLPLIVGVVGAVLFFASVLLHELAHSLMAMVFGTRVRNITLFLFGGVSNIEREPHAPKEELAIAIVGPVVSLGIGFGILAVVTLTTGVIDAADPREAILRMGPLSTMFAWLGSANVLVGVFNLIPGFPLDGGRILRSIIWMATGNLQRATSAAVTIGQVVAALFVACGILMAFGVSIPFFGRGLANGLWLVFIGWFLYAAASQTRERQLIEEALSGTHSSRLMRRSGPAVPPQMTMTALVDGALMATDERAFPVLDNGRLVGLVCLDDVRKVHRDRWDTTTVEEIMTPEADLATIHPETDAVEALRLMSQRDVNQLPVIQNGRLVGMVHRRDFVRWLELHWPPRTVVTH